MKRFVSITFVLITFIITAFAQKVPVIGELKQVSQVPCIIPQRITGMAFDGEKFWFSVYLSKGHYATFDPKTEEWKYSGDEKQHRAIRQISQPFNSSHGIVFVGKTLWLGGSYGESFGSINTETWQVEKHFTQKIRPDLPGSQSYSSFAFDGTNIWAAWHGLAYSLPTSETQLLLKINPETGKVIEKYPLPAGSMPDSVHGLTFDGAKLWHIKDRKLSAIDLNGQLTAQYELKELGRPSGLAWDGNSLWIVEFNGKVWNLPFKTL
ncbi:MAG TPA: hypothetical protein VNI84_20150 [Pyrinomonadaceae bacterium]|nr:hypothetical protein [Pyrinomonadaceae bacterium]